MNKISADEICNDIQECHEISSFQANSQLVFFFYNNSQLDLIIRKYVITITHKYNLSKAFIFEINLSISRYIPQLGT
jgi:hypothetical protein